ncbi:MAG: quinate 5-dehydrogenase [Clostridiales bacterium]|nr:quinate 5-dehydrogenase [Clostridiales bacterium]
MRKVVSVSLGSSKRNHAARAEFFGEEFLIERIGTDGDMNKLISLVKELDGKVDAFGMGGIDLYLNGENKRYIIKDAIPIMEAAKITPMVDGSGLKNTLEKTVIEYINQSIMPLKDKKVLMTSACDRYGMAKALHEVNANITFGDLIFALNIPIPIKSFKAFQRVVSIFLPIAVKMPFEKLYPTGKEQDIITIKYEKYYEEAEIIAGDYLFIKKYMPVDMRDKIIITNTVTISDIEDLKSRGVKMLITTTPEFNGRSFGTNVIEALLVSLIGKKVNDIKYDDYDKMIEKLNFTPRVEYLNGIPFDEAK